MKKLVSLFLASLSLGPLVSSARVVTLPFIERSSQHSLLRSVELTDTATRFNLSLLHRPGYWCQRDTMELVGKSTGKVYPLLRSEGYEIGVKQAVGKNGRFDYVYVFPPLDPSDTIVDMRETGFEHKTTMNDIMLGIDLGSSRPEKKYVAKVHGIVSGGDVSFLYIVEPLTTSKDIIMTVPVDNNEFNFTFSSDTPIFYEIASGTDHLSGGGYYGAFMPEGDDIEIEVFMEKNGTDVDYMVIDGPVGSMTHSLAEYNKIGKDLWYNAPELKLRDSLQNARAYYLPEYYQLEDMMLSHPEKKDSIQAEFKKFWAREVYLTPEAIAVNDALGRIIDVDINNAEMQAVENMKDLAGLFALAQKYWFSKDAAPYLDIYTRVYRGVYPDHPYSKVFDELDNTFEPVPGNPFNDFTAPDFDGKEYTLSDLVNGRPALLDLWASWCGPCRTTSSSMIPVYNDFASKGFTIVGVARESGTPVFARKAVEEDGYPWLNLVDLDDKVGIWSLYRCSSAAGQVFLIGADGKIVAVNPSAEEVRAYLEKSLK